MATARAKVAPAVQAVPRTPQAGEGVLHDVLGVADVAEHPERQVDQERAVFLPQLHERGVAAGRGHTSRTRRGGQM
jgi:hypothetical protein